MKKYRGIATIVVDLGEHDEKTVKENWGTTNCKEMEKIDEEADIMELLMFKNVSLKVSWFSYDN